MTPSTQTVCIKKNNKLQSIQELDLNQQNCSFKRFGLIGRKSSPESNIMIRRMTVILLFIINLLVPCTGSSQNKSMDETSNINQLIQQYFASRGNGNALTFDSNNIKQYWIDNSVAGINDNIQIILENKTNTLESVPLRFEITNISSMEECNVVVLAQTPDTDFFVLDSGFNPFVKSTQEDDFLDYHVLSTKFQIEASKKIVFYLKFSSKADIIKIKKILISFKEKTQKDYLSSPGLLMLDKDNIKSSVEVLDGNVFITKGKSFNFFSNDAILATDNTFNTSVRVTNTGKIATRVYVGYSVYSADGTNLRYNNYPYKNTNKILTVLSSEDNSDIILVDSYSDWRKNCYLALDPKEDLSDIPNTHFVDALIQEVKKLDNGQGEIHLSKPLSKGLPQGTKIRIHDIVGGYIYPKIKVLQPGEEVVLNSSIKKNDNFLQYSEKFFSRGVHNVKPLLISEPVGTSDQEELSIKISDYSVSY